LNASGLIWVANPGMQGGRPYTELLLGLIEPSGRLPISFTRHVGQQPTYYNPLRGQHGGRYADLMQSPAFAFGEGFSYSWVEHVDLEAGETQRVSIEIPVSELAIVDADGTRVVEPGSASCGSDAPAARTISCAHRSGSHTPIRRCTCRRLRRARGPPSG
jgi:hypothetical protein